MRWTRGGCDELQILSRVFFRASVIRTRIPKSSKHDLKKWPKDRPGPERSEATRGELTAAVRVPSGAYRIGITVERASVSCSRNALRIGEVVRVGLHHALWRIELEHAIRQPVLLAVGDGFF